MPAESRPDQSASPAISRWIRRGHDVRLQVVRRISKQFRMRVQPFLRAAARPRFTPCESSDVVISFTSFPARIGPVWAVVDTLFLQDAPVKAIVLVLSDEEFPERRIPAKLRRRVERGLTIHWTTTNRRSFNKLLPTLESFPEDRIVIVDDDKLYPPDTVSELLRASDDSPRAIIGHRGRCGTWESGRFRLVLKATAESPSEQLLLAGNGGVLYPPGTLHPDVFDYELARRLCPTHDDVWFWAMALRAGTSFRCLGTSKPARLLAQNGTPALSAVNATTEGQQLDAVVDHFGFAPSVTPSDEHSG